MTLSLPYRRPKTLPAELDSEFRQWLINPLTDSYSNTLYLWLHTVGQLPKMYQRILEAALVLRTQSAAHRVPSPSAEPPDSTR